MMRRSENTLLQRPLLRSFAECVVLLSLAIAGQLGAAVVASPLVYAEAPAANETAKEIGQSGGEIIGEETTVFDVYLADSFKGSALTHYTESWFEIDDPQDVVVQIQGITNPAELIPLLTGRIEKLRKIEGLGTVRVDLRTFRIILDVDPRFLPAKKLQTTGRLPDPNREFSLLQSARVATSGALNEDFSGAVNHRTVAAYGKYFSRIDGTFVESQPYILTEGVVGGVAGDFEFGSGFIQTPGQTFASSVDVLGFRFRTSDQIWEDQEIIRGSKLQVFIPSRSRVEFYRDGRLIGVQVLDYGLQDVNTRSFPEGSYDVDIVIYEDNGNVQRETRFYTKSGWLALTDKPMLDLSVGVGRDRLDLFDIPVYQAGVRWRVADALQLGGSAYGTEGISVLDLSALSFYRDNFLTVGSAISTEGNAGIYSTLTGNVLGLVYSLSATQTLNPERKVNDPIDVQVNRDESLITSRINDISRERVNYSGNIAKQFGNMQLGVVATQNRRLPDPFFNSLIPDKQTPLEDRFAYGPRFEWRVIESLQHTLRFETFYLRSDEGNNFTARLSFLWRFDQNTTTISELRHDRTGGRGDTLALNTLNVDMRSRQNFGTRALFTNELRDENRRNNQNSVTNYAEVNHMNNYVRGTGFIRDIRSNVADDVTRLGMEGEGAFIVSDSGEIDVSRPIQEGAAIVVNLESKKSQAKFQIYLNDQLSEVVSAGEQRIIGVQPYRRYKVTIRPAESVEMLSYANTTEEFTVFPGNIVKRTWKIDPIVVVVGRLVDKDGAPIRLKRIKGTKDYVTTEEDGSFQMDLLGDETLSVEGKDLSCSIKTPDINTADSYLFDVGELTCE